MENLKVVDRTAGLDVLRVWLFDLPELAYITALSVIDKKKELTVAKDNLEAARGRILLDVSSNFSNQGLREAEVTHIINEKHSTKKDTVNILSAEHDKLIAQRNYYETIFKTVKDVVYYQHRQKELAEQRDLNKQRAEVFK